MGLDITAYPKLEPVPDTEAVAPVGTDAYDFCYERGWVYPSPNDEFPGRAGCIEHRPYRQVDPDAKPLDFRAGSYSGYNWWRARLAELVGISDLNAFWNGPKPGPFTELINFTDCDGVLGPEVSAKLLADFREWDERAKQFAKGVEAGGYWFDLYHTWTRAFEIASDGGLVEFH